MPEFVVLLDHETRGALVIEQDPALRQMAGEWCASSGVQLKQFKLLFGSYQAMMVCEAPTYQTISELARSAKALGDFRVNILLSFREEEYRSLLAATRPLKRKTAECA